MNFEAVIFDLDGTLADTLPLTVFAIRETVRQIEGKDLSDEEILKEFGPIDIDIVKLLVNKDKQDEAVELYVKLFTDNFCEFVKPIDGIKELLIYLRSKNIKTGLFTGRGIRVSKIIIELLGIKDFFEVIVSGELTKKPKPDPDGIFIALGKLGVKNAQNTIYVGDFDVDILASKAAGATSVLAIWSSTGSEKIIELKPDQYFKTPNEFVEWLRKVEH